MSIKENVVFSLVQSRKMLDGMIAAMESQDDWMFQTHPKANHPLWIVGHLALADNMFLAILNPEADHKPDGWEEVFWFGTEISSDPSHYPDVDTVLNYCRERRESLLKALESTTDEFLLGPAPEGGLFAEAPNMAALMLFTSYHEGVHSGQFSIAHRGLGHEPLFQPNKEEQEETVS